MRELYIIAGALIGAGLARVGANEIGWIGAVGIGVILATVAALNSRVDR
jgi:hypothetical protein